MTPPNRLPMLGITGYSGSGKTTLLEKLLPALADLGLRVAVIKHSHHQAGVDKPGKDSFRMTAACASQVMLASETRWALMTETPQAVTLDYLARQFDPTLTDLILVEGFKQEPIPKILLHRQGMLKPLPPLDEWVLAVAADYPLAVSAPCLDLNNTAQIAAFIAAWQKKMVSGYR